MKIVEPIAVVVGFGALLQFIKWILDSLGVNNSLGDTLTFLFSLLLTTLMVIIIILMQQDKDLKRIKGFLKKKGFRERKGAIEKMVKNRKSKRGSIAIDPRILFWIIVLILLYLFLKSIGIFN
ncbi:hypothetical protein KAJ87_01630 [Candidatus Pacearchaeota archaeon]|nr:hypothetical protein [Candidatus Pacearchaeota archaeon]